MGVGRDIISDPANVRLLRMGQAQIIPVAFDKNEGRLTTAFAWSSVEDSNVCCLFIYLYCFVSF